MSAMSLLRFCFHGTDLGRISARTSTSTSATHSASLFAPPSSVERRIRIAAGLWTERRKYSLRQFWIPTLISIPRVFNVTAIDLCSNRCKTFGSYCYAQASDCCDSYNSAIESYSNNGFYLSADLCLAFRPKFLRARFRLAAC